MIIFGTLFLFLGTLAAARKLHDQVCNKTQKEGVRMKSRIFSMFDSFFARRQVRIFLSTSTKVGRFGPVLL